MVTHRAVHQQVGGEASAFSTNGGDQTTAFSVPNNRETGSVTQ